MQHKRGIAMVRNVLICAPEFSYKNAPITPQMPPTYMTPAVPRLRLPLFSVIVSPTQPNMRGMPCMTARGMKDTISNIFAYLLALFVKGYLVLNEKFAADDEEDYNAGEDIAKRLVKAAA